MSARGAAPPAPRGIWGPKKRVNGELTARGCSTTPQMRGGPDGRPVTGEESPDSLKQRCRVTPGQSNLTESATENRPPCMQGKGETVGQEPTGGLATAPAWQAPPGAMPNRGIAPRVGRVASAQIPGLAARGRWRQRSQMNGRPFSNEGQNPAYKPSARFLT